MGYALLCGVLFSLLDVSNRKINGIMLLFFALVLFVGLQSLVIPFGSSIYFFVLMAGALLPKVFQK